MLERRRPAAALALELAALRVEHDLQANLIVRMADALYMSPGERDLLAVLEAEISEIAAWAAAHGHTG